MKCGDKTQYHQTFCPKCQVRMAQYPVDANAVPVLPNRLKVSTKKKRPLKPEAVIADLKKANRMQRENIRALRIAIILIFLTVGLLVWYGLYNGYIHLPEAPIFDWTQSPG